MKYILFTFYVLSVSTIFSQTENPNYDSIYAKKLHADDYGMKKFILVLLKSGQNQNKDKDFTQKCFRSHMENIIRMTEDGKLFVAGPFIGENRTYRGLFILNVETIEEAKVLLENDMAIKEDVLSPDFHLWYGSAALGEYLTEADKIWKSKP